MSAGQTPLFELESVAFALDGRTLLHPTSLVVPAAHLVGLIGHNGSGKSTLLKLLARQLAPTSGALRFAGRPLASWRPRDLACRVAYLPQNPPPAEGLTVRELVTLGRYPWHGALGRFSANDRRAVEDAIELTGIGPFADRFVDTLSGGERQRTWLAMLIAQEAKCLLLDEPTSALDIAHQLDVLTLIRKLRDANGLSVVVVLHDINLTARFCDEIIALHGGRPIARGTPAAIMTPATLKAIYGVRMDILQRPAGMCVAVPAQD